MRIDAPFIPVPLAFRNESYHIATQEDSEGEDRYDPPAYTNQSTIPTPTQSHASSSNVMMIEEDNNKQTVLQQPRRIEVRASHCALGSIFMNMCSKGL